MLRQILHEKEISSDYIDDVDELDEDGLRLGHRPGAPRYTRVLLAERILPKIRLLSNLKFFGTRLACSVAFPQPDPAQCSPYRGTSLTRNCLLLGPYSRLMLDKDGLRLGHAPGAPRYIRVRLAERVLPHMFQVREFFIHNLLVQIQLIIEMILVNWPFAMGV